MGDGTSCDADLAAVMAGRSVARQRRHSGRREGIGNSDYRNGSKAGRNERKQPKQLLVPNRDTVSS